MAESFVKTKKRDYVSRMPKPDAQTALQNLSIALDHDNELHPHSALKYSSPRNFRQRAKFNNLSVTACPDMQAGIHRQRPVSKHNAVIPAVPNTMPRRLLHRRKLQRRRAAGRRNEKDIGEVSATSNREGRRRKTPA